MNIYLAARFGRKQEMQAYAYALESVGHGTTSSWVFAKNDKPAVELTCHELCGLAMRNSADIARSDLVMLFTERDSREWLNTNTRFAEVGEAIGRGIQVMRVGPAELNLYSAHPRLLVADNWLEALAILTATPYRSTRQCN